MDFLIRIAGFYPDKCNGTPIDNLTGMKNGLLLAGQQKQLVFIQDK